MTESSKKKVYSRTTVRLPDDLHRRVKIAAAHTDETIQNFIAQAIEDRLRAISGMRPQVVQSKAKTR